MSGAHALEDRAARFVERVPSGQAAHHEVVDFLLDEAALLDEDRQFEWLDVLTDDVHYFMPVRETVHRRSGGGVHAMSNHFDDDRNSLTVKVRRNVEIASALDRDPPPRTRRIVSNVRVWRGHDETELAATSYVLLLRNVDASAATDLLSARRDDVLRRTGDGLRLTSRIVVLDQTRLSAPFFNVIV